jgi:hypothetical protein
MRTLLLLVPVVAVGLIGTISALHYREGDTPFEAAQRHLQVLSASAVEALVRTAPAPTAPHRKARRATCVAGGRRPLRNPWECTLSYGPGLALRYRVAIRPNGSYVGTRQDEPGFIRGCCVAIPS